VLAGNVAPGDVIRRALETAMFGVTGGPPRAPGANIGGRPPAESPPPAPDIPPSAAAPNSPAGTPREGLDARALPPDAQAPAPAPAAEPAPASLAAAARDLPPLHEGAQIVGQGANGPVVDGYAGRWADAVDWLRRAETGDARGVLEHPQVPGRIDVVWGDARYGLAHIMAEHRGSLKIFRTDSPACIASKAQCRAGSNCPTANTLR
jgi:hypothetical protein